MRTQLRAPQHVDLCSHRLTLPHLHVQIFLQILRWRTKNLGHQRLFLQASRRHGAKSWHKFLNTCTLWGNACVVAESFCCHLSVTTCSDRTLFCSYGRPYKFPTSSNKTSVKGHVDPCRCSGDLNLHWVPC